jgi:hypothetical protein
MQVRLVAIAAAGLMLGGTIAVQSFAADEAPKMSAAQIAEGQTKAQVANTLVILGRAAKDPDMLIVAAKLLGGIGANVSDPKASSAGARAFYDVNALVEEAKTYSANRSGEVATVPNRAGFCHYEYLCDSLSCSYVWVC